MAVEVAMNTPLADALNMAIQPKLVEVGWATGGADDSALSEYIILMLVNGKTQDQIAAELAGDLLSLGPDDPGAQEFAKWLFNEIESLNARLNGPSAQSDRTIGEPSQGAVAPMEQDTEMSMAMDSPELNAPTGPKSMRNGNMRGREKRMFGQMAKAMDRSHDPALHRVRVTGNERINTHNRAPPTGPRGGPARSNNRMTNNRAAGLAAGLNQMAANIPAMPGAPGMNGMNGMNDMNWMMQGGGAGQEQIFNLLQQQNQMMAQLQQQLAQQTQAGGGRGHGRSLFDRVQNPRGGRRGGHHVNGPRPHHAESNGAKETGTEGEDVEMTGAKREPLNPEMTVCKFNLACTNKECKFAHQSPAAPPNTAIDINDVCTYGAACKNRKCVGRHPSPATRRAHQNEQDCKFYPNCTNPSCPFKHPEMPPCRNGGDCAVEGCKFVHLQTMCKYKPCTNRYCPYKHEEGQRGTFQDKVWTADGTKDHVSERKFVDQSGPEELIVPGTENALIADHCTRAMTSKRREDVLIRLLRAAYRDARRTTTQLARRPAVVSSICPSRPSGSGAALTSGHRESGPTVRKFSQAVCRRAYATATASNDKPQEIAVLGGGITGLTTAHYLARYAQNTHITLYEASDKLGGWANGQYVDVAGGRGGRGGKVLFQRGPRTLRSGSTSSKYDEVVLYDVIASLNMEGKIRHPGSTADSRYIYYPDHLVKLPSDEISLDNISGSIHSFLSDPIWDGTVKAGLNFWSNYRALKPIAPPFDTSMSFSDIDKALEMDESVGMFMERICGDDRPVKNLLSGVMHGIYGGDVYKLSAKETIFDSLYYQFMLPVHRGHTWVALKDLMLQGDITHGPNGKKIIELAEKAIHWKLITFEDGLLSLVNELIKDLQKRNNVTIKTNEPVTSLAYEKGQVLKSAITQSKPFDRVISTIFSKRLAQLAEPKGCLPSLAETHAVTIMVVNLWYPNPNLLSPNHGFGYLIPSSTPDNDECVLGVIFDSDLQTRDEPPGTKLTVMLGGHYWDGWKYLPTEELAMHMATEAVRRHLGLDANERPLASAVLCRECLPQHTQGHRARMKAAHYELMAAFQGRLSVAGPSYTGIGVIPAMRAGYDVAMHAATGLGPPYFKPVPPEFASPDFFDINDHLRDRWSLSPKKKSDLYFKKWSDSHHRYLDDSGQWQPGAEILYRHLAAQGGSVRRRKR
ncbi:hypothetical protein F4779DRAFT_629129 [Xylariaceae sp. FL0662B]|nr:hypothetical protein F4779DRAFT_629129 [Xylariaceae sp. FL0662B]